MTQSPKQSPVKINRPTPFTWRRKKLGQCTFLHKKRIKSEQAGSYDLCPFTCRFRKTNPPATATKGCPGGGVASFVQNRRTRLTCSPKATCNPKNSKQRALPCTSFPKPRIPEPLALGHSGRDHPPSPNAAAKGRLGGGGFVRSKPDATCNSFIINMLQTQKIAKPVLAVSQCLFFGCPCENPFCRCG